VHPRAVRKPLLHGGNHFEYSEVHGLQQVDQNLAQINMIKCAKLD